MVGGDRLTYEFDSISLDTDLTETKLLINSVISDTKHGDKFVTIDLKYMFLHTTMEIPDYMKFCYE